VYFVQRVNGSLQSLPDDAFRLLGLERSGVVPALVEGHFKDAWDGHAYLMVRTANIVTMTMVARMAV